MSDTASFIEYYPRDDIKITITSEKSGGKVLTVRRHLHQRWTAEHVITGSDSVIDDITPKIVESYKHD